METDNELWADAKCADLLVEFLTTNEELSLYTINLYNAAVRGREVDRRNRAILGKGISL